MTIYLDSNIFIYAFTDDSRFGRSARALLAKIKNGEETAVTSAITFNEGIHVLRKISSFEDSVTFGEQILGMPNLKIIGTNNIILYKALQIIKKCRILKLFPFDDLICFMFLLIFLSFFAYECDLRSF